MKDAYYFSHDSNAKDDPKCVLLIEQLGMEGYGIFWVLIETLREQPEYKYPIALIPALARRYNTTSEKMRTVVMGYKLFEVENDEFFYSESLNRRMEHLEEKRLKASFAGQMSAKKKSLKNVCSTDVQQTFNECPTTVQPNKVKESKVNEIKEKSNSAPKSHNFIKPTAEEIAFYCNERKNGVNAQQFFDFYESKGWVVGKTKMRDWKACVRTWEQRDGRRSDATNIGAAQTKPSKGIEL